MDFVRSKFDTNEPLPVEDFFPHFLTGLLCYSHLFNKRGGWNKRGGGAKVAKSLNVEAGINVEGGFVGKK